MFHVSYFNSSLPLINESITFYSTSCTYLLIEVFTRLLLLLTLIVSTTSPQQIVSNVSNNSCHFLYIPRSPATCSSLNEHRILLNAASVTANVERK